MKLYGSFTSPFVRKCRITAIECDLADQITFHTVAVLDANASHPNPLNMVPSLETDTGELIVDSRVICEFLNDQETALSDASDWSDRTLVAMSDGLMDRAVALSLESRRPADEQSPPWQDRRSGAIRATLPELERRLPDHLTPGAIALVCALGYLDFRHEDLNWRNGHTDLSNWFETMAQRPSVIETRPPQ